MGPTQNPIVILTINPSTQQPTEDYKMKTTVATTTELILTSSPYQSPSVYPTVKPVISTTNPLSTVVETTTTATRFMNITEDEIIFSVAQSKPIIGSGETVSISIMVLLIIIICMLLCIKRHKSKKKKKEQNKRWKSGKYQTVKVSMTEEHDISDDDTHTTPSPT